MKTVKSLKNATKTEIFYFVAKKFGSDNIKDKVYNFLKNHSIYGASVAYWTAYHKYDKSICSSINTPIAKLVSEARRQKANGKSSYSKVLILGNTNIYWASDFYGHSDYNKSIAMPINEISIRLMNLVNSFLNK